jgi:hypothetical protein
MLFSDHYAVLHTAADDWFDPVLSVDTKLFVDPFLIFTDTDPTWAKAHDRIIAHFQEAFELLADAGCDPKSVGFASAIRMLQFPEPPETCLGYTSRGTGGAGSGKGFAKFIASSMCDAVGRGIVELRHFEQLGILEEGIGPDRISDITCTILKPELISYTQQIAGQRGVPMHLHRVRAGAFDSRRHGFVNVDMELPTNPATGGPLLLVPERFLRDLPSINADDWWDAMRSTELRDEFNSELHGNIRKKDIVTIAKRHPDKVDAWVRARESRPSKAYDLVADPLGVYQWSSAARRYVRTHPVKIGHASDAAEFAAVIDVIVDRFRHFVEENGGWRLLWHKGAEKPEEAAQLVFLGIAMAYCEANGIVVDREVQLGRGPVDFKFSNGYEHRALLEVKKVENGKFWNGLRAQLLSYMKSDKVTDGWFLAVRYRDTGVAEKRVVTLPKAVKDLAAESGLNLRYGLVDARSKTSASKLDADDVDEGAA